MAASSSSASSSANVASSSSSSSSSSVPIALQHDPRLERPSICGPDDVEPPYPIYMRGPVQHGFKRGSKDLGCPTANLPEDEVERFADSLETGVHYGYARVQLGPEESESASSAVLPMVMSIGWNPYYKNEKRTAEVHILHHFSEDFYGREMRIAMLGFIRPEYNYTSLESLIDDIETDKRVSKNSLDRPGYTKYLQDPFFDWER